MSTLIQDSIAAIENPRGQMVYSNVGKAMQEIWRLEQQLGLPKGPPIFAIRKANARVLELRGKSSLALARPAVATVAPPVTFTAAPAPAADGVPNRTKQLAIARVLGLELGVNNGAHISNGALWESIERSAFMSGVTIPGMGTEAELSAVHQFRTFKNVGFSRFLKAEKQQKINSILESK